MDRRERNSSGLGNTLSEYDFSAPRLHVSAAVEADRDIPLDKAQANYLGNVLRLAGLVEITLLPGAERCYAARNEALQQVLGNLEDYLRAPQLTGAAGDPPQA